MKNLINDMKSSAATGWKIGSNISDSFQVKDSEEISGWSELFEKFNYSPRDFYSLVEKNLASREIPGAAPELGLMREAGILSPERLYLTIKRERLVFFICAAPFGNGFFVSSRLVDYRSGANFLHYLIGLVFLFGMGGLIFWKLGLIPALLGLGLILTLFWSFCRKAASVGGELLDQQLSESPILGKIYQSLFRPDTYYRRDTTAMFQKAVDKAVRQSLEEMTNVKGVRLNAEANLDLARRS